MREWERGKGGAKSYDGKKACPSIKNSILSGLPPFVQNTEGM